MKHCKLFLFLFGLLIPFGIHAKHKEMPVIKYINFNFDVDDPDEPISGNRIPAETVPCSIDSNIGINIMGEDNSNILSFEIWDTDGNCISTFDNEADFIGLLFKMSGEYEIRLITEYCIYIGYIRV